MQTQLVCVRPSGYSARGFVGRSQVGGSGRLAKVGNSVKTVVNDDPTQHNGQTIMLMTIEAQRNLLYAWTAGTIGGVFGTLLAWGFIRIFLCR